MTTPDLPKEEERLLEAVALLDQSHHWCDPLARCRVETLEGGCDCAAIRVLLTATRPTDAIERGDHIPTGERE